MKHYDHTHATVAEARACEAQRREGTTITREPQATPSTGSVVMDRLRRQAGQPLPTVCVKRTNTEAHPVAKATRYSSETPAYVTAPAHPKRVAYAKDLIGTRDTNMISVAADEVLLNVVAGNVVSASEIALLIDNLRAAPRRDRKERPAYATQADEAAPRVPRQATADTKAVWAEWRTLAAELVATSSHPSGARFAIENEYGDNDLSFWWISKRDGQRGAFYKLRQVIGGGRREEVRDPQRMVNIAKRIKAAGAYESMIRYGQEIGACGHCGRDLTNEESRAAGIGPVCRSK